MLGSLPTIANLIPSFLHQTLLRLTLYWKNYAVTLIKMHYKMIKRTLRKESLVNSEQSSPSSKLRTAGWHEADSYRCLRGRNLCQTAPQGNGLTRKKLSITVSEREWWRNWTLFLWMTSHDCRFVSGTKAATNSNWIDSLSFASFRLYLWQQWRRQVLRVFFFFARFYWMLSKLFGLESAKDEVSLKLSLWFLLSDSTGSAP